MVLGAEDAVPVGIELAIAAAQLRDLVRALQDQQRSIGEGHVADRDPTGVDVGCATSHVDPIEVDAGGPTHAHIAYPDVPIGEDRPAEESLVEADNPARVTQ